MNQIILCPTCRRRGVKFLRTPLRNHDCKLYYWCDACQEEKGYFRNRDEAIKEIRRLLQTARFTERVFSGKKLFAIRKQKKMNIGSLAKRIGCLKDAIRLWENENAVPKPQIISMLGVIFHVGQDFFYEEKTQYKKIEKEFFC